MNVGSQAIGVKPSGSIRSAASQLGYWSAILTALVTAISFTIAIVTPPISGPFCQSGCVGYPYTNVVAQVPRDYLWMYPALLLGPLFVVLMACVHRFAPDDRKVFSLIALSFALIFAALISIDYYIQLTVLQPSLLNGEEGLTLFSQYNPHGIFIAFEELAYLMMSLAFLFAAAVFTRSERTERVLRSVFVISFVLMIAALVTLSLIYGQNREYRFEVAAISIDWLTLIISGVLLSNVFRRAEHM